MMKIVQPMWNVVLQFVMRTVASLMFVDCS